MARRWELRPVVEEDEPTPYLLMELTEEGAHIPHSGQRFSTEDEALRVARALVARGLRIEVYRDVAASYGVEE